MYDYNDLWMKMSQQNLVLCKPIQENNEKMGERIRKQLKKKKKGPGKTTAEMCLPRVVGCV